MPCSATGQTFHPVKFQIDIGALCNTISDETVAELFPELRLHKSIHLLIPYGASKPIKPVGQLELLCEKNNRYFTLCFQVIPTHIMGNKPALLSGRDCESMGIITIDTNEVYTTQTLNSPLKKTDITGHFADVFKGIGCLQPPVSFKTNDKVTPVQMPIHRVPIISKRQKEKTTLEQYVADGILVKVDEPTPWCSNILCRESPSKFRVCIDPSQTINKAIEHPIWQRLNGTITIADDILVFGKGDSYEEAERDHDKNIIALLERAQAKNLCFNPKKLQFKQKNVKFVGHIPPKE